MHPLPSLRHAARLALAIVVAMPAMAQTAPPPAAQAAPPPAAGQNPPAARGNDRRAVPANKPVKATQPSRSTNRKQSPYRRQPAPEQEQQPGQPTPQGQAPAPPNAQGQPPQNPQQQPAAQPQPPVSPEGAQPQPAPPRLPKAQPAAKGQPKAQTPPPVLPSKQPTVAPSVHRNPTGAPMHPVQTVPVPVPKKRAEDAAPAPAAPASAATAPTLSPANPPAAAAQTDPVQEQPAAPAETAAPPAVPVMATPALPPSPELGLKPPAPGAAMPLATSAARSGELNPNTYFADWKEGAPALWIAQNDDKGIAAKQGSPDPNSAPVLEMIPDKKGWSVLTYRVNSKTAGLAAGDSLLYEVELLADAGAPVDIVLRMIAPGQKDPMVDLRLPYAGEGVWRTLRLAVTMPAGEVQALDAAIRLRGAKPGSTVWVRRASLMLIPPV